MESKRIQTGADPLHLCHWRQRHRLGKKIMNGLAIQQDWLWAVVYIILMTLLWPLMVLIVSIPFGQFTFFRNYIRKLGEKLRFLR
jgi:hypothetical protein